MSPYRRLAIQSDDPVCSRPEAGFVLCRVRRYSFCNSGTNGRRNRFTHGASRKEAAMFMFSDVGRHHLGPACLHLATSAAALAVVLIIIILA
jgi:hypothetical protein